MENYGGGAIFFQISEKGAILKISLGNPDLDNEQQSKLKCKIQRSIVYDYLKTISEYNSKYP